MSPEFIPFNSFRSRSFHPSGGGSFAFFKVPPTSCPPTLMRMVLIAGSNHPGAIASEPRSSQTACAFVCRGNVYSTRSTDQLSGTSLATVAITRSLNGVTT
jgi:hypothetical protein